MSERLEIHIGEESRIESRNTIFVFIGPPTAGKTTFSKRLVEKCEAEVVRGADILPELSDKLSKQRELVTDEVFIPALEKCLSLIDASSGIVLENIPRTREQASFLVNWAESKNIHLVVVDLRLTKEDVLFRGAGRLVCPCCNESYHAFLKPSLIDGYCNLDGSILQKRCGDDPEVLEAGHNKYVSLIGDVIAELKGKGELIQIDASEPIDSVWLGLYNNLVNRTMNR